MNYKIVMKTGEVITFDNPRDFSKFVYTNYTGIDLDESYDVVTNILFDTGDEKYIRTLEKINKDFYYPRKFYMKLFDIVHKTLRMSGINLVWAILDNTSFSLEDYGTYVTKFIHYSHNSLYVNRFSYCFMWPLSDRDLWGTVLEHSNSWNWMLTSFEWKEISHVSLQTKTLLKKLSKIRDKLIVECYLVRESLI